MEFPTVVSEGVSISSNEGSQADLEASLDAPVAEVAVETELPAVRDDAGRFKPTEKPVEKPRNRRDDPQEAVKSAVAKQREAERRAEQLQADLDLARKPKPVAEPVPVTPQVAGADPEPTVDKFDTYEKFVKAQARWEARQEIREQQELTTKQAAQDRAAASDAVKVQQFSERLTAARDADPTFIEKVDQRLLNTERMSALKPGQRATFGNFLVEELFNSEHPKELLLHLSNQTEVQRLATLPPEQVIRELAKFEATLTRAAASSTGPAPAPPKSQAKPPIKPVGGSSQVASDDPPGEDASDAEHEAYWGPRRAKYRAS